MSVVCRACGKRVNVNADGTVRMHQRDQGTTCNGSGLRVQP